MFPAQLLSQGPCSISVDVRDYHVGAFRGQALSYGAADAVGASGYQRDPAGKLFLRGGQSELVKLLRPVLGVESVLRGQGCVAVHRHSSRYDPDRMVVYVRSDVQRTGIPSGHPHAKSRHQDHPGVGVQHLRGTVCVAAVPLRVRLTITIDPVYQDTTHVFDSRGVGDLNQKGRTLGVEQVVGRYRTRFGQLPGLLGADETQDLLAVVEPEKHSTAARRRECRAKTWSRSRGNPPPLIGGKRGDPTTAEDRFTSGTLSDELLRPRHQLDMDLVAVLGAGAPGDQAVVHQRDPLYTGPFPSRLGDGLREPKPGVLVGTTATSSPYTWFNSSRGAGVLVRDRIASAWGVHHARPGQKSCVAAFRWTALGSLAPEGSGQDRPLGPRRSCRAGRAAAGYRRVSSRGKSLGSAPFMSHPLALTSNVLVSRPRKSVPSTLREVLPPPHITRSDSAPTRQALVHQRVQIR